MSDLATWLLDRITEDEAVARALQAKYDADELRVPAALVNVSAIVVPRFVLAECAAKRRIVEELLATRHEVVEDCWYTCAEATEERDGGTCCDDSRRGTGCDCGRDARVDRYLRLLALPYADRDGYDPAWRP